MRNIKAEAERLRIGLVGGWVAVPEVVAWADELLASEPDPPPQVIDLSLAGQEPRDEVIVVLRDIPGTADRVAAMRQSLADLRRWIGDSVDRGEQAARWLYALAGSDLLPDRHFGAEPHSLDDHFTLARAGTYRGSPRDALAYLQQWLDAHSVEREA